jgi:hypothetical protein
MILTSVIINKVDPMKESFCSQTGFDIMGLLILIGNF